MVFRNVIILSIILTTSIGFSSTYDWGKTGHRVVGEVASNQLTRKARKKIDKLLGGHSLAFVSTYADDIKSDRSYKKYSPWHYVNFPFGKKYADEIPSQYGDLIIGIRKCIDVLKDKNASVEDQAFYLKMLVHFLGDLHQPLHVGRSEDKGGNAIQVQWFKKGSNIHRVWDSEMIDYYGMSYTELSHNMDELTKKQKTVLQKGSILDWAYESQSLAEKVYTSVKSGEKIGYRYSYDHFNTVCSQLQKGGIRLAKILNEIFG